MLPELQPYTQERAEKLIDLLQSKGTTIARSHCNIEPVSGLKNLQNLQAVLARRQAGFECEIVAFPQHGLLLSKSEPLMREAMQAGAHYVGGLDPTSVDGAMEKSSTPCFRLRWTTTKVSIFTCTKPLRRAWQPSIIWLKR